MRAGAQDFILKQDFNRSTLERSVRFAIERHQRQVLSQRLRERDTEYNTARNVQQRLMPREFPTVPGYELAGRCRSADAGAAPPPRARRRYGPQVARLAAVAVHELVKLR